MHENGARCGQGVGAHHGRSGSNGISSWCTRPQTRWEESDPSSVTPTRGCSTNELFQKECEKGKMLACAINDTMYSLFHRNSARSATCDNPAPQHRGSTRRQFNQAVLEGHSPESVGCQCIARSVATHKSGVSALRKPEFGRIAQAGVWSHVYLNHMHLREERLHDLLELEFLYHFEDLLDLIQEQYLTASGWRSYLLAVLGETLAASLRTSLGECVRGQKFKMFSITGLASLGSFSTNLSGSRQTKYHFVWLYHLPCDKASKVRSLPTYERLACWVTQ